VLTHPAWDVAGVRHGFLDGAETAGATWDRVLAGAGVPSAIAVPRQVHGTHVAEAVPGETPRADAVVVRRAGLLVGVVTADCVPVLLVERGRRVAAAVHAGWRGAAAGVLEAAVARLGGPPADVEAAVGPAIGGCCYEVGPEVEGAFRARTGDVTAPAWHDGPRRRHVDLRLAARLLLQAAGVTRVALVGPCTACDRRYSSYRRDGAGAGRQLSFVGWA
jgi:YfiH family protein